MGRLARQKAGRTSPSIAAARKPLDPPMPPSEGSIGAFVAAWTSKRNPFNQYVEAVSDAFYGSHLSLENAAALAQANPMEVWAVLRLASLDEAALQHLSGPPPPKTTWLLFADADAASVEAGLQELSKLSPGDSPSLALQRVLRDRTGPSEDERVAALPAAVLWHMAQKAESYNAFPDKHRNFLKQMGRQKKYAQPMTPAQITYLRGLLTQLADAGVVRRNSPDGDEEICVQVLEALGR